MKIKTCPHCGEPLICKACGKAHTPRKEPRERMSFRVGEDTREALERISEETGEPMTTVLENAIKKCAETDPRD